MLTQPQQDAGQFLACQCAVTDDVVIGPPVNNWYEAQVAAVEHLSSHVCRLLIDNPGLRY